MSRTGRLGATLGLALAIGIAAGPGLPPRLPPAWGASGMGPSFRGDPQAAAEVQAAFQKFVAAPTWRARITSGAGGTQTMEHVAPDRFHMLLSQGTQQSEMFMIGRDVWVRAGDQCQKLPAAMPMVNPREAMEHTGNVTITVAKSGPEVVEGVPTQTYAMTVDVQGKESREKLYVATGTGLPRRFEIRSDQGTTVIDYVDYGAQIAINSPPC